MTIPGSEGIRVHDRSLNKWINGKWTDEDRLKMIKSHVLVHPYCIEVHEDINKKEREFIIDGGIKLSTKLKKSETCQSLLQNGIIEAIVTVSCESTSFAEDLKSTVLLSETAIKAGLEVRAYILHAFSGENEGDNIHLSKVQDAVTALADCGAKIVMVEDTLSLSHEDSMREVVEEAFYLDVVGDTMLERLGISASLESCRVAARLGVQHFDASLGKRSDLPSIEANLRDLTIMLNEEKKATEINLDDVEKASSFY
eukprot:CAMPEP_0196592304 /NCGR_PEP_ID=MMETSP1081-20130531/72351_1 /TAXON_ID=36882 /ORGANISM="Pyramimonas amylifera, Strain CCMP720" /LENGTH=255 /DNA_ID=CAMNT_0041915939 /DNA_START=58 /DNA_END=825 /DNA_ORIENTATION=-